MNNDTQMRDYADQTNLLACRKEGTTTALLVAMAALCTLAGVVVGAAIAFAMK